MTKQLDIHVTAQDPETFIRRLRAITPMNRRTLTIVIITGYICIAINIALIAINVWLIT